MYYFIVSGKNKAKLGANIVERLSEKLKSRKEETQIFVSEYAGHTIKLASELCKKEDCQGIVAVGGDGTFFEVLNGVDTKTTTVGFIPCGNGNDLARTLGISIDLDECLDNIFNNEPKYLDYMQIGNLKAFNVIGSGFDIQLLEKEDELRKKNSTKNSYQKALLHTIMHFKFYKIKFRVDDGEWESDETFMVDCCNGKWGAGMMPLCIPADPHDGYMDFTYIKKFFRPKVLPLLLKFQKGKLTNSKYVVHRLCKKVEIDIEPKLKANLDGELFDLFPNTIELISNELKYFPSSKEPLDPYYCLKHKKTVA